MWYHEQSLPALFICLFGFALCIYWRCFLGKCRKFELRRRNVLITGAARGIGKELANQLLLKGSNLILWDNDKEKLDQLCAQLKNKARKIQCRNYDSDIPSIISQVVDVGDYTQVHKARKVLMRSLGEDGYVSLLINNAGVVQGKRLMDLSEEDVRSTFNTNTLSHFWTIKEFLGKNCRVL